jgi:hypothetical protein
MSTIKMLSNLLITPHSLQLRSNPLSSCQELHAYLPNIRETLRADETRVNKSRPIPRGIAFLMFLLPYTTWAKLFQKSSKHPKILGAGTML